MKLLESVRRRPVFWICIASTVLLISLAVAVLFLFFSPIQVDSIRLDRSEITFHSFAQTQKLTAVTEPADLPDRALIWTSSDTSVATVSDGVVTAVGNGEALISVRGKQGDGIAHCVVTVTAVSSITFNSPEIIMGVGSTRMLQYTVEPAEIDIQTLVWTTSDPSVVSVYGTGVVRSLKAGTCTVTVATADGSVSQSCTIRVTENIPITGLSFSVTEFVFRSPKDVLVLTPVFTPEDTSQRDLGWISSSPDVATVDPETGEVTPLSNGETTIIAQSLYGDFSASCKVIVDMEIPVEGLSLETTSYTFKGLKQTYWIRPVFTPTNASNQTILWTSSDSSIAKVSDQGLVTALKKGTVTIKAVTEDGGYTAEFTVTVDPDTNIPVSQILLKSSAVTLKPGQTHQISATIQPENATNKTLTYTSQNTAVARVSASGLITAVGNGSTTISVSSKDGKVVANCLVTVEQPIVVPEDPDVEPPAVTVEEVRGVWVATVANIDFPSKNSLTAAQLKTEIDAVMDNIVQLGLNTVYFQVRPCGDALYPSNLYPSSAYVVKKQGDALPLDILEYAIQSAHERGISFHAWINPYRVTSGTASTSGLAANNPAKLHPEWVLTDGKQLYLNPGLPEVRQYIIDGVMEIVNKYNVDGIHFDDYFYPNDISKADSTAAAAWDDSAAYAAYGNGMSLADWRRANNDALVKGVYNAIKGKKADVSFGISPAGVWAKKSNANPEGTENIGNPMQTYTQGFADTRKWVVNGWLDYICPQIYWEISHTAAPFKPIVDWWNDLVSNTNIKLYVGVAAYKCGGTSAVSAYTSGTEIPAQLDYLESKTSVHGVVFYNYSSLMANYAGIKDQVKSRYYKEPISTTLQFSQPSITIDSSYTKTYVVGISDPNYPLYANGETVYRTPEGYFSYAVTLTGTKTTVRFVHKGQTVDYVITKVSSGTSGSSNYMTTFGFAKDSCTPSSDTADRSGTSITFSCVAPAGSNVTVKIGSYSLSLTTTTKDPNNGKYLKATYTGSFTLPQTDNNKNQVLGHIVFQATRKGESATYSPGSLLEIINDPASYVMQVSKDKADVLPSLDKSVYPTMYRLATEGAKFHVVSKGEGKVKLSNGMYMNLSDVQTVNKPLSSAKINTVKQTASAKNTVFAFTLTDTVFHTVWMDEKYAEIILYNISGNLPTLSLSENPLFASAKVEAIENSSAVRIVLNYKTAKHIYGYTCHFDGNTLYVSFRNPVTLASGDKPLTGVVISLDPGHCNPKDVGANRSYNGKTVYEADLNWNLTSRVAEKLQAMGATVVLSHQPGCPSYSLDKTIAGFRALNPDLNLSIHFNAVDTNSPTATGTETYWCYGNSRLLADSILKSFTDATGFRYRKSERGHYKVSRLCEFPSVLLETAFISNQSDLAWFMNDSNMNKAATAIANGLLSYFQDQNN